MSVQAITWAFAQEVAPSSAKFVLVTLANYASEHGLVFPSIETVAKNTGLDRKTVVSGFQRLVDQRFMIDTGRRVGENGRVKVYRLLLNTKSTETGTITSEAQQHDQQNEVLAAAENSDSTGNGMIPKTEADRPKNGGRSSRFSPSIVPKTGHRSVREPSEEPSRNQLGPQGRPVRAGTGPPIERFDEIQSAYPRRPGHQRWQDARNHIRARLREGDTIDQMIAGVQRYARFCEVEDIVGTHRVLQAATFFGTNRCYREPWDPESPRVANGKQVPVRHVQDFPA